MKSTTFLRRVANNIPHVFKREPCFFLSDIMLTYRCTERCLQCAIPQKADSVPAMKFEDFKTIVDKLDAFGAHGLILTGGELLLHPRWLDCLEYAASKRFTYLHALSTLYASRSKIEKLTEALFRYNIAFTCSFDGFGQIADDLRGARDVARIVMENMKYLDAENLKRGRPIKTGVNIVVSQMNLAQIPEIIAFTERIGWLASVDVYRFTSDHQRENEWLKIKDLEEFRRVMSIAESSPVVITPSWVLRGHVRFFEGTMPKHCPYLSSPSVGSRFFVHPNGDVKVCLTNRVGNLLMQTPQQILDSVEWREQKKQFDACPGCWTTCHTPLSKLSNYGFKDSIRAARVLRNFRNHADAH
jgi:MoaA/NifB/PqqE/SkfB family radical SAM enzyme